MTRLADRMNYLGTETAFEVMARANMLEAEGREIINLGIGQPDFKTPAHIVEAAVKALHDGHHGYTPANGIPRLREAVSADLFRRLHLNIPSEQILIVPGGKVTMFLTMMIYGEPGCEILYPNPGFPIYESAIRFSGAKPVPIRLREENGFAFSADEVLSQINTNTRLIILNSPANPTGGVVPKKEIDALVRGLIKYPNVAIMSDEIYGQMLYDDRTHTSLLQYPELSDRLILLDGWSKTYAMTGWRLGYSVWPKNVIRHAEKLCVNIHSCVNASAQFAGIAALEGDQQPVNHMVSEFELRRKIIIKELNQIPGFACIEPGGAFYAFPNVKNTGMTSQALQNKILEEAGVAVIAGTSFGDYGEGYLRFSYANSIENIQKAIQNITNCLA
ncbi:MAG: pyridoxal phosphate-dependent aminotransferase [Rhodospirillaceae bacterium]|nr:pyridoxal phosphate-dependent aminotransferase [Rhodospirillaceae bacterium]MBT7730717.1 pyridoxal phosphate-dependent aminotransferase [Rhodospirillaceae bacterium]MDC0998191.1 pyridoxal phosphate-dependent aminotransferase [Alphaproteobacteria bacterium]MDC1442935.1 pyridoxal phosphate-dependent aminotransferase [Rhodospirillaceae bacterium]